MIFINMKHKKMIFEHEKLDGFFEVTPYCSCTLRIVGKHNQVEKEASELFSLLSHAGVSYHVTRNSTGMRANLRYSIVYKTVALEVSATRF